MKPHDKQQPTIKETLSNIIYNYRYPLLSILGITILGLIGLGIYNSVMADRIEEATIIIERIEEDFQTWKTAEQDDEWESMRLELLTRIDSVLESYSRLYPAQRGYLLKGHIAYVSEDWAAAATYYETLADTFPDSYLAPVALMNGAVAMEHAEDFAAAEAFYQRVTNSYENAPNMPYALFSLGRVREMLEDYNGAVTAYNKLLERYPNSYWTNLGRNRIIYLETR